MDPSPHAPPPPFDSRTARTWVDIDLDQIGRNVRALRARAAEGAAPATADLMAVVKADAYGHGAVAVAARACLRNGATHVAVATTEEARALRAAGVSADLYLLSPFLPGEADALVRADVIPMVSSRAQWDALVAAAAGAPLPARAFLKVDTGMGRSGCLPDEATVLWNLAARPPRGNVHFTGIATHFSSAEEPDPAPTEAQLHRFHAFLRSLGRLDAGGGGDDGRGGRQGLWLSWANSPAVFRFPAPPVPPLPGVRGYLARAGLALYGVEPFPGAFAQDDGTVKPALSWHARVTLLRDLPAGATVGYGRTFTLARPSRIATLAVGYADGLSRRLSNRGHVLLGGGARCPIVGRISMDQCQVDVTDAPTPVQLGNVATLIGSVGAASQRVVDLAALLDTTPHEPLCAISHRVPRRYHPDGGS